MSTAIPGAGSSGVLSIRETAWILGVDRAEVYRLIRVGVLPTIRRRSRLVVPAHALARLLPAAGEREDVMNDEEIFEEVAARLDDLEGAPIVTLFDLVTREGACMWIDGGTEEPTWTGEEATDRELAATLCAGCLVADECLELEFRTAGLTTLGVWGALSEEDRRAAYLAWVQRRKGRGESR